MPRPGPPSRHVATRGVGCLVGVGDGREPGLDVAPFVATRYADPERLAAYTAPAYDLIEPAERARLISADPRSIVHLTLPTFGAEDAAARLAAWRADGTFAVERAAALYVYELAGPGPQPRHAGMGGRGRAGAAGGRRAARGHGARPSSPTGGPCAPPPAPTWSRWCSPTAGRRGPRPRWPAGSSPNARPTRTSPTTSGVRHRLWRVADPAEVATVRADFARRHAVIADGHHRWAAASPCPRDHRAPPPRPPPPRPLPPRRPPPRPPLAPPIRRRSAGCLPRRPRRPPPRPRAGSGGGAASAGREGPGGAGSATSADVGAAGRVLALVVPAGEHGPQVRAIHRVLPGTTLDRLDVRHFRSAPTEPLTAAEAEELLAATTTPLVLATDGDRWRRLTDPDTAAVAPAAWRELPVALVDVLLVGKRAVVLRHSVAAAVDEARRSGGVALLVPATPTATVLDLAARGVLMPRKSTFFVPKPRTGLVLRCFADQR